MTRRGAGYPLWELIEDTRLNRGWTAVAMAEALGLSRNTISRLATGARKPEVHTVHTIADALQRLGVDIDRTGAERLAGLRIPVVPVEVTTRQAVMMDPRYTETQKRAILEMLDIFDRVNRQR